MAMFDVYVEGATDPSPAATKRLAEVMSQRYGLPAADLVTRLTKGRFRVKANLDHATATTYARDLEAVGARVTVAEAQARSSTLPPPRPGVSQPPADRAGSSLPPENRAAAPRPGGSSLPPANANPNQPYASGLAAAFHEDTPIPELGALDNPDAALASLDGHVDKTPILSTKPSPGLPASIGPATGLAPKKPAAPKDVPLDLFAPPEAQANEFKVELAADEIEHREARKRMSTPPPQPVVQPPSSPVLRKKSSTSPPPVGGVRMPSEPHDEAPRWRFAAGVLASVVLGFIPAHCVASIRESSSDETIDAHVISVQVQATTSASAPVPYAQLDVFRDAQLDRKKSQRRNIALVSLLIWGIAGAGVGYVWFRRVPWDKIKLGTPE